MNRSNDEEQGNIPSAENSEAIVDQFVEITGVDRNRARFYLETACLDLPLALSAFYEGGFEESAEAAPEVIFDEVGNTEDVQIIERVGDLESAQRDKLPSSTNPSVDMSARGGGKPGDEQKKKFGTLFPTGGAGPKDSGSSDDDESDKGQAFYVGGSEKSGQQVLGPPKKKGGDNVVEKFFQQARERGAEQIDNSQRGAAAAASSSSSSFGGAGYRLGDAVKPPEKVGGSEKMDADVEPETVTVIMRMWRDGFTIDDDPLRTFDSPADRQFLEHIMQGRLPPELVQTHRGKRIDLEMEDHRQEDYKPAKRSLKAFSGQGHTLGSPVPQVVGAGKVGEKSATTTASNNAAASADGQVALPPIDETKPTTNIQVRLGNGERLVLKLNNSHTVKDLRTFIRGMRPDLANRDFMLMTGFPNKELENEQSTLEESNLLNAVIIQRFK